MLPIFGSEKRPQIAHHARKLRQVTSKSACGHDLVFRGDRRMPRKIQLSLAPAEMAAQVHY
jgi:hypothetical protein